MSPPAGRPIIVLTACAWDAERERATNAGCDLFLAKPCELFTALGESIGGVTVPENAVEPPRTDQVLSVRPMAVAG